MVTAEKMKNAPGPKLRTIRPARATETETETGTMP
jgi:hypothetical protein